MSLDQRIERVVVDLTGLVETFVVLERPHRESEGIHGRAEGRLRKVRSSEFVPVEASVRAGAGTGAVVESWLSAARAAADKAGVAVARAVVFEASADRVRGAILGAKIAGAQPAPLPPIKSIDVKRGDPPMEPARQPQVWSVELHVARPAPRGTHPQGTHP